MENFYTKVVGVKSKNPDGGDRQKYIAAFCKPDKKLLLKLEPDNPHDENAISVWVQVRILFFFKPMAQIGYLSSDIAKRLTKHINNGGKVDAYVKEVTGGTGKKPSYGVNIEIEKY